MRTGTISGTMREESEVGKSTAYLTWHLGLLRHRTGGELIRFTPEKSHDAGDPLSRFPTLQNTFMEIK